MQTLEFTISGITCDACVKMCSIIIKKIDGVGAVSIDRVSGAARVESSRSIEPSVIRERLAAKGYAAVMK